MGDRVNNMGKMLNNPKQRNIFFLGIGIMAVMLVAGVYIATRPSNVGSAPSGASVSNIPNVNSTPGSSTSPDYNKKVQAVNDSAAQAALTNNKTFVPTPTSKNSIADTSPIDLIDKQREEAKRLKDEQDAKDAAELQRIQNEERAKLVAQPIVVTQAPVVVQPTVVAEAPKPVAKPKYSREDYILISTLIGNTKAKSPASEFNFAGEKDNNTNNANNANAQAQATQTVAQAKVIPLEKAGTILNAILETAVNSDEPGAVLAKVISGPLKGTRLIGSIQNVGEKVVLQFSTANIPNLPNSTKISAVAVDPETTRSALASDVDHHYFQKYGVLLASSFLSGWSQAIARQNTTTTVSDTGSVIVAQGQLSSKDINKQALGNVGTELGNSVRQSSQNVKPTVTVNSGIAIGILLMEDFVPK